MNSDGGSEYSDGEGGATRGGDRAPETLFDAERLAEIREVFGLFDAESTGSISVADIGSVLRALGFNPSVKEAQDLVSSLTSGGTLTFPDLLKLLIDYPPETGLYDDLIKAFSVFDKADDGYIDADSIRYILTKSWEPLSEQEVDVLMQEAVIEDGRVNYADFARTLIQ